MIMANDEVNNGNERPETPPFGHMVMESNTDAMADDSGVFHLRIVSASGMNFQDRGGRLFDVSSLPPARPGPPTSQLSQLHDLPEDGVSPQDRRDSCIFLVAVVAWVALALGGLAWALLT